MPEPLRLDLVHTIDRWGAPDPESAFRRAAWKALAGDPRLLGRSGEPAHFTASALPISPDGRRVCLVLHGRIGRWVQPGGHFEETDGSVAEAAGREMREETGLTGEVDPVPLHLSRHAAPCREAAWHLDVQLLAVCPPSPPVVDSESDDAAWFDAGRLPQGLAPGVAALVAAARQRVSRTDSPVPPPPGV